MNQSKQQEFLKAYKSRKVIVVCRNIEEAEIVNVAQALYNGGIRFMEVPFDQRNTDSHPETARKIRLVSEALKGKMHVGAGTVCTMEQFRMAKEAGAEIIVAPNMDEEIIAKTKRAGLISIPGCMTPSEMLKAHKAGADLIKLFPASVLTLNVIKELALPLNHLSLVCFGGITAENLKEVLAAGAAGVGVASAILDKKALADREYKKITELAESFSKQIL